MMKCDLCGSEMERQEIPDGTIRWWCPNCREFSDDTGGNVDRIAEIANGLRPNTPEDQYRELIELFIEDNPTFYDSKSGIFWMWNAEAFRWEMAEDTDILRRLLNRYAIITWLMPGVQGKVIDALKVFAQHRPKDLPPEWVQFRDKLVNVKNGESMYAEPAYFTTNPIPWAIGQTDDTPIIDKLFVEWVGEEHKTKLYELCAYSMYRNYPLHRMFFLIGVGRNGKGTFYGLLSKFVGADNCTSTDLSTIISSRFESARLLNKLVCGISELNVGIFRDTVLLKQLVGGDQLRGEFKGKALFDFHNYAKIVIMTNTLPETSDKSDGWYSRYIPIDFPNQFDVGKDRDVLSEIPDMEFESLALKSTRILHDLLEKRMFAGEGNIAEKRERYESKADLLNRFLNENYESSTMDEIPKFEFQEEFETWCRKKNVMAWSATQVNRALRELGYEVQKRNFQDETTNEWKNWWFIVGLRKKDKADKVDKAPLPTHTHSISNGVGNPTLSAFSA